MNSIPEKENEPQVLDLLFAQRALYSSAKKLFAWRISAALGIAIVGPIVTSIKPSSGAYIGIVAIAFLLLDSLILEVQESKKRLQATKAQELFDTQLFNLPWNSLVCRKRLEPEILGGVLDSFPIKDYSKLRNWYSPDVGKVDIILGRLLCQRSNAWWDNTLRNRYMLAMAIILVCALVTIVSFSVLLNSTVAQLISGVIVPILPLAEAAIKQIKDNMESASATAEIQSSADESIEKIFNGEVVSNPDAISRAYQDAIFRHRVKCPMIPDWVYHLFRERQESQMQFAIENKVSEYLRGKKI